MLILFNRRFCALTHQLLLGVLFGIIANLGSCRHGGRGTPGTERFSWISHKVDFLSAFGAAVLHSLLLGESIVTSLTMQCEQEKVPIVWFPIVSCDRLCLHPNNHVSAVDEWRRSRGRLATRAYDLVREHRRGSTQFFAEALMVLIGTFV